MNKRHVLLVVFIAVLLIGIVLFLLLLPRVTGPTVWKIDVLSGQPWQKTAARVKAGQTLKFLATGQYAFCMAGNESGPGGIPQAKPYSGKWPANDLTGLALIGRIGETGKPFLIGEESQITATQDGELYMMVNDDILNENDGTLHVTVTLLSN